MMRGVGRREREDEGSRDGSEGRKGGKEGRVVGEDGLNEEYSVLTRFKERCISQAEFNPVQNIR